MQYCTKCSMEVIDVCDIHGIKSIKQINEQTGEGDI